MHHLCVLLINRLKIAKMKSTTMLLLGGALLVAGGWALSKRMSTEDKQKLKDLAKKKLGKLPFLSDSKLSASLTN
jgi:hypothetical protein